LSINIRLSCIQPALQFGHGCAEALRVAADAAQHADAQFNTKVSVRETRPGFGGASHIWGAAVNECLRQTE
jgi:hypothetical protein